MAFPAQFLELTDIGRRVRMETEHGAVIEDTLVGIHGVQDSDGELKIAVETKLFNPVIRNGRGTLMLLPDSSVQYVDEQ